MRLLSHSLINTFDKTHEELLLCCRPLAEKNGERKTSVHSFHIRSDDDMECRKEKETTGEGNYCHNKDKSSVPLCNHTKKKTNQSFLGEPLVFSVVFGDKLTEPETLQCVKSMWALTCYHDTIETDTTKTQSAVGADEQKYKRIAKV